MIRCTVSRCDNTHQLINWWLEQLDVVTSEWRQRTTKFFCMCDVSAQNSIDFMCISLSSFRQSKTWCIMFPNAALDLTTQCGMSGMCWSPCLTWPPRDCPHRIWNDRESRCQNNFGATLCFKLCAVVICFNPHLFCLSLASFCHAGKCCTSDWHMLNWLETQNDVNLQTLHTRFITHLLIGP